jgi:DNA-nicking Smr family endonuclease
MDDDDEPVRLPIEDFLDLHAFSPKDVASVVEEYVNVAYERGFREVRVIHGRGIGVQRAIVHSVLSRHPFVLSFAEAPADRGGWGATIVRLRDP